MKRRPAPAPDPGVLPDDLAGCVIDDWLEPGELPTGRLSADESERLEILAWGRFRRAFAAWHEEAGVPRPYPVPRPRWRSPR